MKTKSNMTVSKLQSEAVKGLMKLKETLIYDEEVSDEDAERDAENQIKQFLSDQIQKAYLLGKEESFNEGLGYAKVIVSEEFNKMKPFTSFGVSEIVENIIEQLSIQSKGK